MGIIYNTDDFQEQLKKIAAIPESYRSLPILPKNQGFKPYPLGHK